MKPALRVDTAIIGAGFAGLSTAYHLSKSGLRQIVVIEQERKLGGHASGNNAGMLRQAVSDPILAKLAIASRKGLGRLEGRGWKGLHFRPNGSLLLSKKKDAGELRKIERNLKGQSLRARWFSKKTAGDFMPLIQKGDFDKALFCPSDAMLDIQALLRGFLSQLRHFRVPVLLGHPLHSIRRGQEGFVIRAGRRTIVARRVVNAAGAWAEGIAGKAGATRIPFHAYRRHLFESAPSGSFNKKWPFVWDISHQFYFRPLERSLLLSPCDKDLFRLTFGRKPAKAERPDPKLQRELFEKLKKFSKDFPRLKIIKKRAGLRTMSPDGRFVVGEDPKLKNFFWVAGLGGHGVTTCLSVGRLAADLVLEKKTDFQLARALSPKRFLSHLGGARRPVPRRSNSIGLLRIR